MVVTDSGNTNPNFVDDDCGVKNRKISYNLEANCEKISEKQDIHENKKKLNYVEALMHLFKGSVGTGCYAMGDAFKNGGLVLAPILTVILAFICVYTQHMLISCSGDMKDRYKLKKRPDYADTVEMCFESGPKPIQGWAKTFKRAANIFICITQLGFCCVYLLFVSNNLKQILEYCGLYFEPSVLMVIATVPIWLVSLITNLKYLAPCSTIANLSTLTGIGIAFYYSSIDVPSPSERVQVASLEQLPLFFGTAVFAFEAIGLVLPLTNSMKKPSNFTKALGVLNIGMFFVVAIYTAFGFIGYLKYGDAVEGSISLNLPKDEILAQIAKLATAIGVLLGYPLQFFVAIQIMFPNIRKSVGIVDNHPFIGEMVFRTFMVLVTLMIAEVVPMLNLLLSLVGSFCTTGLALVFPPIMESIIYWDSGKTIFTYLNLKNMVVLGVALLGFFTGTFESIKQIVIEFNKS